MATQVVFDDIVRYLREQELHFGIGERNDIRMAIAGDHGEYGILIHYPWEREVIVVYAEYSSPIPEERRAEVLEMAARINWGLLFGTCEFHPDTGRVRFRSLMLTDDAPFHTAQFATVLSTAVANAERYAPAVKALLDGRATVVGALSLVEA